MTSTKVAVITPCWNWARYLPRFLSALRKLELNNIELMWFFAYAPSQDETLQMLESADLPFKVHIFSKKDVEETNGNDAYTSAVEARNCAYTFIRNTYGDGYFEFISSVDADVIIPPNFFTCLLPHFENPQYAAIFGWGTIQNKFLQRIEELRVDAKNRVTWESPICSGGATIYREHLYIYYDTRFKKREDTDFILSMTKDRRNYYKTLYVNVGMIHLHDMSVRDSLTTYAFQRGYYQALLSLKHPNYFGNPYIHRGIILYFGVILDSPLCILFLATIVPWWLGIWSIVGMITAISWSLVRHRKGILFSTYDTVRELVTHLGLLCGLVRYDIMERLKRL